MQAEKYNTPNETDMNTWRMWDCLESGNYKTGASAKKMNYSPLKTDVCTKQSVVNERPVSVPYMSSSPNLSESTSTVILVGYVRGPDLKL